jgi:peptidoglycan DL-endopeptidase LytE
MIAKRSALMVLLFLLPVTAFGAKRYVVKKGDNLSNLAKRFRVSPLSIKKVNSLSSDRLNAGDTILIPDSKNEETEVSQEKKTVLLNVNEATRYVVKKGDNLSLISRKFNVSVKDLKSANHIRGDTIRIDQVLSVPSQGKIAEELSVEEVGIIGSDQRGRNNDSSISRDTIIKIAKRFLGAPYKFGGTSPIKGIDCSAFVGQVFSFFNVDLPRTARELFKIGRDVDRDELASGDLVFFRTYARYPSHVGIYIGDSEFIHASSKAKRVTIDSIDRPYFTKRYIGAKRIENAGLFYEEVSKGYRF